MTKEISFSEIKKHKDNKSLWIVIHNQVYDVTKFLAEHPGGEDALLEYGGKDGTQAFEDVGHSEDARELMKKYKIGILPAKEKGKDIPEASKGWFEPCPLLSASKPPPEPNKTWRTYDGSPESSSYAAPKSPYKKPQTPKAERHVDAIVVPPGISPNERRRRASRPPRGGGGLKWALLALAAALIIGYSLKKYME